MKTRQKDRALDVPAEANRDKHINYLEEEERSAGIAGKDSDEFKKRMRSDTAEKNKRKDSNKNR